MREVSDENKKLFYYTTILIDFKRMSFTHQDWNTVVISKKSKKSNNSSSSNKDNKSNTYHGPQMSKIQRKALDNDGSPDRLPTIDRKISLNIQQARQAKNLTRKQLANIINQPVTVIAEYEDGKAIPKADVINKLEKALGKQLRK